MTSIKLITDIVGQYIDLFREPVYIIEKNGSQPVFTDPESPAKEHHTQEPPQTEAATRTTIKSPTLKAL